MARSAISTPRSSPRSAAKPSAPRPATTSGNGTCWYLNVGRQALVDAIEALAEPGRGAVVFHCAAGKDRTGVLAALVLAMLDVGYDDIVADYAVPTNRALPRRSWAAWPRIPCTVRRWLRCPPIGAPSGPRPCAVFPQLLDDKHGGARRWAESAATSPDVYRRRPGRIGRHRLNPVPPGCLPEPVTPAADRSDACLGRSK